MAFFITVPIYSPNVVPLQECIDSPTIMGAFVNSMMISSIVSSAAILAVSLLRPQFVSTAGRTPTLIGCAAYLLGMLLFLGMAASLLPHNALAAAASGILLGPGTCSTITTWGSRLCSLNLRRALFLICVICGSTAAANWIFSFLPPTPLVTTMAILAAAGCLYPVLAAPRMQNTAAEPERISSASPDDMPRFSPDPMDATASTPEANDAFPSHRNTLRRFASVMLPALVGLSMFAFFMGTSRVTVFNTNAEIVGNIAAAVLLAPLCFLPSRRPFIITLFQVVIPLAACAALCATVLAYDFGVMEIIVPFVSYAFFCGIAQISLALGVASMKGREFSPSMTWSFYLLLFAAFSMAGLFFGSAEAYEESEFVSSSLLAAYCAFLIAHAIATFTRETHPPAEENAPVENEDSRFDKRCDALAERFAISPREREIMAFLGRGHTSAFIAKSLIISESTVYTHTRNIYRKLGIGSKEELIQILFAPQNSETPDYEQRPSQ